MRIAAAEQMRRLDGEAIQNRGIPSTLLMERAAGFVAEAARGYLPEQGGLAVLFCGPGNNGGDGVCAGGLLLKNGVKVKCLLVGKREKMTPDTREMARRLEEYGGRLEDFDPDSGEQRDLCQKADVLVDAIFGIGLNSDIRGGAVEAIRWMNESPAPVIAADIASGVETDTGRVLGTAVKAAKTITFTCGKAGHFAGQGRLYAGEVVPCDIGIPRDLVEGEAYPMAAMDGVMAGGLLPSRPADGHKGDFGKVYILAGSVGYTGAPVFAARSAVRSGGGLVYLGTPHSAYPIVAVKCDEAIVTPLLEDETGKLSAFCMQQVREGLNRCDCGLIGPGLGRSEDVDGLVRCLVEETELPLVLDADGINALSGHIDVLDRRKGRVTVLTPHDGEFARLGGDLSGGDRIGQAAAFARAHGCVLVLKGHCTITAAPDGRIFLNTTGNAGMAKGGSGDVLSGIILSLMGQGMEAAEAAAVGVWVHGRAGDRCRARLGQRGMTPSDMVGELPFVFQELENEPVSK